MEENFSSFFVEDLKGRRYHLTRLIGKGGQGKVYLDETGKFIIKISKKKDTSSREKIRQQFRRIRQFSLETLPITRPLELLRPPYVGYLMEYISGMEPISRLSVPPKSNADIREWFIETGGLSKRLDVLARCAEILNKLHGKGLVYGDLSPNNIFISNWKDSDLVYLIDIDNLNYENDYQYQPVYTRFYGAPEIIKTGHYNDSLTDAFSFAIIACETLTLNHPFRGDYVNNGDPEFEELAMMGEMPWIYHSSDDRNFSTHGLPKDFVLSSRLFELCQKTFEPGLHDRKARPGVGEWMQRLYTARQFTLECSLCKGSYYREQSQCPWCSTARQFYILASIDVVRVGQNRTYEVIKQNDTGFCIQPPVQMVVTRRMVGYSGDDADQEVVKVHADKQRITVQSLDKKEHWITSPDWRIDYGKEVGRKDIISPLPRSFPISWRLHLGDLETVHRVIRFSEKPGVES